MQRMRKGRKLKGERRGKGRRDRRGVTEGKGPGLHHPTIEDKENSYSRREYRSLKGSNEWHKEWQC